VLIHIYFVNSKPASIKLDPESGTNGRMNGMNGHAIAGAAEEFELDGLTSEDEAEGLLKEGAPRERDD